MENTVTNHGYGVAAQGMVNSLLSLGHSVPYKDASAPVEIAFCQPYLWEWSSKDSYKIGYVPWESTRLPDSWLPHMHRADEIWTTSPWCKLVYEKAGFENVRIYEHGVDTGREGWTRKRRRPRNRPQTTQEIRFLHIGEPAPRKGGQLVYDTFIDLFGDSPDVSLTIKTNGYNTIRGKNGNHPHLGRKNVKLITQEYSSFELVQLVKRHDVLVYPSWGEGFGLIPLQALVTGMPVICTEAWAPYSEFLLPELALGSRLTKSPWPDMHPGLMYEPDAQELADAMALCAAPGEYDSLSLMAYANSFKVETAYDWDKVTAKAFEHIFDNDLASLNAN